MAQQLYEGVDLAEGEVTGLITYMRTDSTNIAAQAQTEARKLIETRYGPDFVPEKPPVYKTRSRGAQEAHEAIRPANIQRDPQSIKAFLSRDQYRLYHLIWTRFIASQMTPAVYETLRVDINAGDYGLRTSGSNIKFPGFLSVYEETETEDSQREKETSGLLIPDLSVDESLNLVSLLSEQHFTQPPPRYSEASLVKDLEEYGIGRPSTYAPTISTIQSRGYVEIDNRRLYPTEVGQIVNDLLVAYFPDIVSTEFTARMEEDLDKIAWGEKTWVPVLRDFYTRFAHTLEEAEKNMPKMEISSAFIDETCPSCGDELMIKYGRFGKFIGCNNFPECRYTRPYVQKIGVNCPSCQGELVERKTKKGRIFYGCVNYPECEWTNWKRPLPTPCPSCKGLLVAQSKKWARCTVCETQFDLDELGNEAEKPLTPENSLVPEVI